MTRAWIELLGAVLLLPIATTAIASAPSGQFIVVEARRDPAITNPQAQYRPDDPQLVNRIVSFSASAVSYDAGASACTRVTETTSKVAAGTLFRQAFSPRNKLGYRRFARPSDFGLSIPPQASVPVTRFRCGASVGHDGSDWNRAALFPIGKDTWGLALVEDFLLILKPAPNRITASFNCAKAATPTERTICSDPVLAGWDRSVQRAFNEAQADVGEQRGWLVERDKCGTNRTCLQNAMGLRVMNLR